MEGEMIEGTLESIETGIMGGYSMTQDKTPKAPHRDELAYMVILAGMAAYAESGDIRPLVLGVIVYAIGVIALRLNAQRG
jgi:hypothetical protein